MARRGPLLVALGASIVLPIALAGRSDANRGRTVRIEKRPTREVAIPAGQFQMGLTEDQMVSAQDQCNLAYFPPNAIPQYPLQTGGFTDFCKNFFVQLTHMQSRDVFLDAYAIDRDEVSVTDYRACVDAGACTLDALVSADDRYIRPDWPMVNVTWEEAQTFCSWRGGRLPTEAEWEHAALGDRVATDWPWGELEQPKDFNHGRARAVALREIDRGINLIPIKNFGDPDDTDGAEILAPPGSYPWGESQFGTRDQAGNVAEWVADAWTDEDRSKGYDGLPVSNPFREGNSLSQRVVRGGSWRQPTFVARSNLRDPFNEFYDAGRRYSHIGFRCARTVR